MSLYDKAFVFVLLYSIIWGAVTATVNNAFADAWDKALCPFPDYTNGYDEGCSTVSHPGCYCGDLHILWSIEEAWYTGGNNWTAGIPVGWANWLVDSWNVLDGKFMGFLEAVGAMFIFPSFEMYGQTVEASELGWFSAAMFAFAVFGVINLFKGWI